MRISTRELIRQFRIMYEQHWKYVWGKAEKGCVDCSGAFVYALRQFGISYPHGSNAIARRFTVGGMKPVTEARPGMAAFKTRDPGEDRYNLPAKYRPGGSDFNGDLRDYYHIGLVDEDPAYVLNAKGDESGFCRDRIDSGGWDFVADLKEVEYGGKEMETEAKVALPDGKMGGTVNLRSGKSTSASVLAKVPVGSWVKVLSDGADWCEVRYGGQTGFMMTEFLSFEGMGGISDTDDYTITPEEHSRIDKALVQIETYAKGILEQVEEIGSVVGRG